MQRDADGVRDARHLDGCLRPAAHVAAADERPLAPALHVPRRVEGTDVEWGHGDLLDTAHAGDDRRRGQHDVGRGLLRRCALCAGEVPAARLEGIACHDAFGVERAHALATHGEADVAQRTCRRSATIVLVEDLGAGGVGRGAGGLLGEPARDLARPAKRAGPGTCNRHVHGVVDARHRNWHARLLPA